MKKLLIAAAALLAVPGAAQAAPPNPFGHVCTPQNGVLFCPTASDAERVPSFDGVPMDVDVTLPPSGDGPFPTLVMMHGWGGNKRSFEATSPEGNGGANYHYNNVYFAQQGYAVVTPSARGFGRSCGAADSRTSPACDRGWLHLADHRYEIRDTQYLLGLLADQGITRPGAIGVTGVSYGGMQSLSLARLRDRVRLPNGRYRPWRSPNGKPMRVAATYARWGGSDMAYALQPNGRYLDFKPYRVGQSIEPGGVMKKSYVDGFYVTGNVGGFYAPTGGAFSSDITRWKALSDRGEPSRCGGWCQPDVLAVGRELTAYHSAAGVKGGRSAPLLIQNGWTDDLFPVPEALRAYRWLERAKDAYVALQVGDFGHPRGQNKPPVDRALQDQGARFFASFLQRQGEPPRHRSVVAYTQTCPGDAAAGGPFRASSWDALHPRSLRLSAPRTQRINSNGGDPAVATELDPIGGKGACHPAGAAQANGTAVVQRALTTPFTLLGFPTVRATISTRGRGGMIAARLWDVHQGQQTLVARGIYRLTDHQKGRIVFQLFGNGWRFAKGHRAKLELLGSDPNFVRASNFAFTVKASRIGVELPGR
jgi:pimeloyl-ACP methyl ester carboxylesterase